MTQRVCEKCGETVDAAKAFCPACGEAFVDEAKRDEPSAFESMEGTMQLGNTMYNQLLSDIGLNISAKPDRSDDVTEPAISIPASAIPAPHDTLHPATTPQAAASTNSSDSKKWLIIAAVAVIGLIVLALIIVGLAGYIFYRAQPA